VVDLQGFSSDWIHLSLFKLSYGAGGVRGARIDLEYLTH